MSKAWVINRKKIILGVNYSFKFMHLKCSIDARISVREHANSSQKGPFANPSLGVGSLGTDDAERRTRPQRPQHPPAGIEPRTSSCEATALPTAPPCAPITFYDHSSEAKWLKSDLYTYCIHTSTLTEALQVHISNTSSHLLNVNTRTHTHKPIHTVI